MLTVINYLLHAGVLVRLLITSRTKPTGGWFSCTNRESISVWGLIYLSMCIYVFVCAHACVCMRSTEFSITSLESKSLWYLSCLLVSCQHWGSDATCVRTANHQHGLPELSTHHTGTVTTHERWVKDSNTVAEGWQLSLWLVQSCNTILIHIFLISLNSVPFYDYELFKYDAHIHLWQPGFSTLQNRMYDCTACCLLNSLHLSFPDPDHIYIQSSQFIK